MSLPLVPTAVTVAAPAANVDDIDDGDSNFTNTSGSLRSKKYTQSKCMSSPIADITNASEILIGVSE